MRLKQIKLAGFKSFVDPTSFDVPGQLVGVVGPNGCGKSNLIDAVRWVLGESKASELRGESMQDVIFSGSSERKPAARASVELVFDNSLGRIGGSWSQFAEISVRRVLTRDGQSSYYINNQPVRRRDVHDMFLGTGLGPRAYAIIGQGMISRIIEARPEELRVFLEEAAGVSKYKERRRETANRLADTRENLTRVDDIRRELQTQIERLQRQAEVAREFRSLEVERERRQHSLWLLRRDEADAEQRRLAAQAADAANQVEARLAEQRAIEAEIETLRSAHYAAGDAVHGAQGRYYEGNAQVGRIEAEIRLVSETQGQLRERLDSVERAAQRAQEQQAHARRDREAAQGQLTQARGHAEELSRVVAEQAAALPEFDAQAREARARVDEARQRVGQTRQSIELCALHERKASEALDVATRRRERLRAEADALHPFDALELERAIESLAEAEEADRLVVERLALVEPQWSELEAQRQPAQQALREAEAKRAQIDGRLHALRQLQERVESQAKVQPWLARHGLERLARLYEKLRIDDGWESAIESVLRERVGALEVGRLDTVAGLAADAPPSKVGFFTALPATGSAASADVAAPAGLRPLARLVHTADAGVQSLLAEWLAGCFAAESLESALAQRASLPPGGQFVVADGHVVGRQSVAMYAADSEQEGVLARRHEIENLQRGLRAQDLLADEARSAAARIESGAAERLAELTRLRGDHARQLQRISALRLDVQRLEQERDATAQSRERIDAELAELAAHIEEHEATIAAENERFEALDAELGQHQEQAESLQLALEDAERALGERREALRRDEREAQEASFAVRAAESSIERLDALIEQAIALGEQAQVERASLRAKLDELTDASARHALQEALEARTVAEQALAQARAQLDDLGHSLRAREEARLVAERAQEPLRQRLGKLQLDEQAARLNREQYAQSLAEAGLDEAAIEALRASLADAPRPSWLQGEVTRLSNAIAALGAVNLAALEELAQAEERKGFLDAQSSDLEEAIATLEDAIRKIDRETRELLQQTYDTVNGHFAKLFPELFGGGEARLILTGDEILDAGIQVLAQPPGKRNTSIQLLSGGEKALTAIALVFALFQLNPAPFCLLDEVDAPLDDANTERYCEMVRRMSDQTQFLFITHNKIAMELAQQLVGVTMQERGVSRIVAVDLDAAARYAEAA
ncbi:MAG: chromosome segregation protein SMC [Burkholderiales bacterium]|nr:MAG: chromosome segregation protein SMC [Burkholderiales bacterium]